MKIATIVGARPQFIKLALLSRQLRKEHREILIHTGQHYDDNLSDIFFKELFLPRPDYNLGVISNKQGERIAYMLKGIERILLRVRPDLVIVYGDTNSTLAGALAAAKLNIPIAHVEAGLRSYRIDMPEEVNRILTDRMSTFLFCPTKNAVENLKKEGITKNVYNTGDVMYDSLLFYLAQAKRKSRIMSKLNLIRKSYFLVTIHRAENTDSNKRLKKIISIFNTLDKPVIFPIHPRTQKALLRFNLIKHTTKIRFIKPISYFDMLMLEANAKVILTDSGGVQKEAFFLRTPCITLRDETEWVETVACKMNIVTGVNQDKVMRAIEEFSDNYICPKIKDPYGDGHTANKIIRIIRNFLNASRI